MNKAIFDTALADGLDLTRDRAAGRPEVAQAVGQKGKLELGLLKLLPVEPVHQLDLQHVEVVLFFGGSERRVGPAAQGQSTQVFGNFLGIDGHRLPERLPDKIKELPLVPGDF